MVTYRMWRHLPGQGAGRVLAEDDIGPVELEPELVREMNQLLVRTLYRWYPEPRK